MYVISGTAKPLGYTQQSFGGSAATVTAIPTGATHLLFSVEGQAVRWRDDGVAPSTTVGMPVSVGVQNYLYFGFPGNLAFIAVTGTATIDMSFYQGLV